MGLLFACEQPVTKVGESAYDTVIAPTRVLSRHSDNQSLDFR